MNKKRIKMNLIFFSLLFFYGGGAYCYNTSADIKTSPGEVFTLSAEVDLPVIAAGSILFISDLFIEPVSGDMQNLSDIFFLDQYSIYNYNQVLDRSCDVLFAASLLLPVSTVIGADLDTIIKTGVMLMESLVLTYSVKGLLKDLIPRYRPYTYLSDPVDDDYMNSFPSGHTAAVFTVCGFSAYVFSAMYPDSEWKVPVIIGAGTLAAATGTLRIVSGNHFITDVAAGALIGSLFGIGIPMLHSSKLVEKTGIDLGFTAGEHPALTVLCRI